MALPGGRKIVVDGLTYEWLCCQDWRASRYDYDDYGDEEPACNKKLTIKAEGSGKLVQYQLPDSAVTPRLVATMIRADVLRGTL